MTEDRDKTKQQLIGDLEDLRRRVRELERAEDELSQVRKALELGMEALNEVLNSSNDILAILRPDGTVAYISPSVARTAGYKAEDLSGANAFDLIHPNDLEGLLKAFSSALETPGNTVNVEFRYHHADASWRTMEAQGINLTGNPAVAGMVMTARDITERKQAEVALAARERYYRSLIRNAADMVSVLDKDLGFKWGSPSASRITGYGPEDVYGKSILSFIHPEDVEQARKDYDFVLQNPGATLAAERRFRHKGGNYHWHQAILTNLLDDPSVRGLIVNSRDITERKLMEEKLLASNRELDSFASTVSHDLRTPLSLIEGYAQLLRTEGSAEEEKEAYLKSVIAAARRMDELTGSLLEYAQAGQAAGMTTLVEPLDILSDVLFEYSSEIEGMGMDIVLGEEFPTIKVDRFKLRQVFGNLVSNAVKYLAGVSDPRVEIAAHGEGETAIFYISDNGPGFDPKLRDEVFLPFKRFGASSSPGLGIGLSTVKRAVEGWGGRIWVESEPGEGAAFFFTAPLASG